MEIGTDQASVTHVWHESSSPDWDRQVGIVSPNFWIVRDSTQAAAEKVHSYEIASIRSCGSPALVHWEQTCPRPATAFLRQPISPLNRTGESWWMMQRPSLHVIIETQRKCRL